MISVLHPVSAFARTPRVRFGGTVPSVLIDQHGVGLPSSPRPVSVVPTLSPIYTDTFPTPIFILPPLSIPHRPLNPPRPATPTSSSLTPAPTPTVQTLPTILNLPHPPTATIPLISTIFLALTLLTLLPPPPRLPPLKLPPPLLIPIRALLDRVQL